MIADIYSRPSAEPDFICIARHRWQELGAESANWRVQCERMSLTLAAMGHDFRQGLHIVLHSIDSLTRCNPALNGGKMMQQAKDQLQRMAKGFEKQALLASVSNDASSGWINECVAVQPILLEVLATWRLEAENKGLGFRASCNDLHVMSNAFWLDIILNNLIGNAVQHTSVGEVFVESTTSDRDWILTIHNSGPGLNAKELHRSFASDPQPRARGGGLGLGLSLVTRATEFLGHGLGVRSTPYKGTSVRLRIALAELPLEREALRASLFFDAT